MKQYSSLLFFVFLLSSSFAQECYDPTVIDPDVTCLAIYDPVCGCDGVTYSNECVAYNYNGITQWTTGECPPPPDPAGCLDLSGLDFGTCVVFLGYGWVDGVCTGISGCSTIADNGFDYSDFIFDTPEECENACSNISNCIDPDLITGLVLCTDVYDPVCGCDGVTYTNLCQAIYYNGVTAWTDGECPVPPTECLDLTDIDFGPCDAVLGYGWVNGVCVEISGCSPTGDNGFDYTDYIWPTPEGCEEACGNVTDCIDPDSVDPGAVCIQIYDPVCGCDDVTYSNLCYALNAGVTSWTAGECPPGEPCLDLTGLDFGPCEAILGYGWVNGECVVISGCSTVANNGFDYANYIWPTAQECEDACGNILDCIDPDGVEDDPLCPLFIDWVCGCDGVTYENICWAIQNGVTSWTDGPCEFECVDPSLIQDPPVCIAIYDPVCGCDGVTYSNFCYAEQVGGVTAYSPGECQDSDGDGSSDVIDCEPFDPWVYPGAPCDDYDPNTQNDVYDECCVCAGIPVDCSDSDNCTADYNTESDGCVNLAANIASAILQEPIQCDIDSYVASFTVSVNNPQLGGYIVSGDVQYEISGLDEYLIVLDVSGDNLEIWRSIPGQPGLDLCPAALPNPANVICDSPCPSDLNNDFVVNTSDLLLFLSDFGTICN